MDVSNSEFPSPYWKWQSSKRKVSFENFVWPFSHSIWERAKSNKGKSIEAVSFHSELICQLLCASAAHCNRQLRQNNEGHLHLKSKFHYLGRSVEKWTNWEWCPGLLWWWRWLKDREAVRILFLKDTDLWARLPFPPQVQGLQKINTTNRYQVSLPQEDRVIKKQNRKILPQDGLYRIFSHQSARFPSQRRFWRAFQQISHRRACRNAYAFQKISLQE